MGNDEILVIVKEHKEDHYLLGMEGLTAIEEQYIKQLIEGEK